MFSPEKYKESEFMDVLANLTMVIIPLFIYIYICMCVCVCVCVCESNHHIIHPKWKWKSLSSVWLFETPWTNIVHEIPQASIMA